MNIDEAEKQYGLYLSYLRNLPVGDMPQKPNREMMRVLNERDLEKSEYAEYERLKKKYER